MLPKLSVLLLANDFQERYLGSLLSECSSNWHSLLQWTLHWRELAWKFWKKKSWTFEHGTNLTHVGTCLAQHKTPCCHCNCTIHFGWHNGMDCTWIYVWVHDKTGVNHQLGLYFSHRWYLNAPTWNEFTEVDGADEYQRSDQDYRVS